MLGKIEGGRRRGDRGWADWMASLTQWIWVWPSSRRWWLTGNHGVLQSMGSQRVRNDWATELNWTEHGPAHQTKTQFYPQPVSPIRKLPQVSYPSEGRQDENHNHRKLIKLITWITDLSNSMKLWAMPCRATQDGWVMVESSDKTWSTGEGNGKPPQHSCLENHMNSMRRNGVSVLIEGTPESILPTSTTWGSSKKKRAVYDQGSGLSPGTESDGSLTSDFQPPEPWEIHVCCL